MTGSGADAAGLPLSVRARVARTAAEISLKDRGVVGESGGNAAADEILALITQCAPARERCEESESN